eukprot:12257856-Alexandrium_andersonii.AAC.1
MFDQGAKRRNRCVKPVDFGMCRVASGVRHLNCAVSEKTSELVPNSTLQGLVWGGSAPFCALSPMVTTKRAGGRAGGASRR